MTRGNRSTADPSSVFAVIPAWNQREETLSCLASLGHATHPNLRVIVVDNGSDDGTTEAIHAQFPAAVVLRNESNRGFAAAVNQGTRRALEMDAQLVLWLNNDTIVDPAALSLLLGESGREKAGMLIPLIYYLDPPNLIWSAGANFSPWLLETRGEMRGQLDFGQWPEVLERQFATACAALIPRATIERVGLLDEQFYLYYDDADFSRRVTRAGLRILLVPQAKVWHKVAISSGGLDTPFHRYWMGRSSVLYFRKHVRGWRWALVAPFRLGSAVRTTLRLILLHKGASAASYLRGLRDGIRVRRAAPG